ncbi:MucR family transcriptional regulator [Oryzomonas rubra]|uniref:MucR family transcriptional regulator n=1 Tax=Oryzomonas rubra TaxID=2509454 RepID=A0A5A9XR54_9BACT|nr:MucR family transcriptional regulator [Oryzomonas rubra]KAA0895025.1 MucR family transcriptional regulator [Oryzomonas rubra]
MTATLVELTAGIVSSHAAGTEMNSDDLIQEINRVFTTLKKLETEGATAAEGAAAPGAPAMSIKKAFQNDQVCCLICGKTGFKTLTRHLKQAHDMKPGQYRKQFNIPASQSLTAKNYSEARRKAANENNLAANLEKARAVRAAKKDAAKPAKPVKAAAAKPVKAAKAVAVKAVKAKPAKTKA